MDIVKTYFLTERIEAFAFISIGLLVILFAMWLLVSVRVHFYNGMAYSLIVIALIQIGLGTVVVFTTSRNIVRVDTYVAAAEKDKINDEEIPRMEDTMKRYVIFRYIAFTLLVAGIALFFVNREPSLWKGIGFGLGIQALVMLVLGYFETIRGHDYLLYLRTLIAS